MGLIELFVPNVGKLQAKRIIDLQNIWHVTAYDKDGEELITFANYDLSSAWESALIELDYDLYAELVIKKENSNHA